MKRFCPSILVMILTMVFPAIVYASNSEQPVYWWQVISGILAIPSTMIGLALTYITIKKTNYEFRKLEVELRERENLQNKNAVLYKVQGQLSPSKSAFDNLILQNIILRFIVLWLINTIWGFISNAYHFLTKPLFAGGLLAVIKYGNNSYTIENPFIFVPLLIFQQFIDSIPTIGSIIIFISFGWPLYKDINIMLGINVIATIKTTMRNVLKRKSS